MVFLLFWKGWLLLQEDEAGQERTSTFKGVLECSFTDEDAPSLGKTRSYGEIQIFPSQVVPALAWRQLFGAGVLCAFNCTCRHEVLQDEDSHQRSALLIVSRAHWLQEASRRWMRRRNEVPGDLLGKLRGCHVSGALLCFSPALLPPNILDFSPSSCPRNVL